MRKAAFAAFSLFMCNNEAFNNFFILKRKMRLNSNDNIKPSTYSTLSILICFISTWFLPAKITKKL